MQQLKPEQPSLADRILEISQPSIAAFTPKNEEMKEIRRELGNVKKILTLI